MLAIFYREIGCKGTATFWIDQIFFHFFLKKMHFFKISAERQSITSMFFLAFSSLVRSQKGEKEEKRTSFLKSGCKGTAYF